MLQKEAGMGTRPKHLDGRERPPRAAPSRPGPCGFRGSLPPQAAQEIAARVLAAQTGSSNGVVRQFVIQNRKGGTWQSSKHHPNNQRQ
jgi:hypothetical protein